MLKQRLNVRNWLNRFSVDMDDNFTMAARVRLQDDF